MEKYPLGIVIAERVISHTENGELTVKIGKPEIERGEARYFYCPFEVSGAGERHVLQYSVGVDAVQALQLAMLMIGSILRNLVSAKNGKLKWSQGQEEGDFGFPIKP